MNSRIIKILFACSVGLYLILVCLNNITDYSSNFTFLSMVSKMEDVFSKARNGWRSVHSPFIYHLLFVLIIVWELAIVILLSVGVVKMVKKRKAPVAEFKKAKAFVSYGYALGVMLWFAIFIAVGGEWFLMWQSKNWNGQGTAFFLTCCFLLFLLNHNQVDE